MAPPSQSGGGGPCEAWWRGTPAPRDTTMKRTESHATSVPLPPPARVARHLPRVAGEEPWSPMPRGLVQTPSKLSSRRSAAGGFDPQPVLAVLAAVLDMVGHVA